MEKITFPNPKLRLPEELESSTDATAARSFEYVDNYLDSISEYVYTDIDLNFESADPIRAHAWILRAISEHLLRSLYIRNAFVEAFNSRNIFGALLALKAWSEIVGFFASILDLLKSNLSPEDLSERFKPYALGNKVKGDLIKFGGIEGINVATMLEKADKYMTDLRAKSSYEPENKKADKFFTNFYDIASNVSHPSFDIFGLVGVLEKNGVWGAKKSDKLDANIAEMLPGYSGLLSSPLFIKDICKKIFEKENDAFLHIKKQPYFT